MNLLLINDEISDHLNLEHGKYFDTWTRSARRQIYRQGETWQPATTNHTRGGWRNRRRNRHNVTKQKHPLSLWVAHANYVCTLVLQPSTFSNITCILNSLVFQFYIRIFKITHKLLTEIWLFFEELMKHQILYHFVRIRILQVVVNKSSWKKILKLHKFTCNL